MTSPTRHLLSLSACLVALTACGGGGGDPMPMNDAGPTDDGGPTDGGARPDAPMTSGTSCTMPRAITLTMGTQTITGDTTSEGTSLDMSGCGGSDRAPQEIMAFTLPAGGELGVELTLATSGTSEMFDTVLQVRPAGCLDTAGASCFDDPPGGGGELRSSGSFLADGGTTVFVIVTGYAPAFMGSATSGPWAMDVTVRETNPPTLTSASVLRVGGERFDFTVMGGDVDGDADGIQVSFLDAGGTVIGLDLDEDPSTPDETEFLFGFAEDVAGMETFTATSRVGGLEMFPPLLTAPRARIAVTDTLGGVSPTMDIDITDAMLVGLGETCDATHICGDAFECTEGTCTLPAAVATACAGATALTVPTPTTMTTTTSVTGSIAAEAGALTASCGDTEGAEVLYTLTVPAGAFDLVATTDTDATEGADTVLYVQATCGDPGSETFPTDQEGCNDDIDFDGEVYTSRVVIENIAAGTYTLGVETFGVAEAATAFGLDVSLRPVLETGAACDVAGVMNRCAAGACAEGTCP